MDITRLRPFVARQDLPHFLRICVDLITAHRQATWHHTTPPQEAEHARHTLMTRCADLQELVRLPDTHHHLLTTHAAAAKTGLDVPTFTLMVWSGRLHHTSQTRRPYPRYVQNLSTYLYLYDPDAITADLTPAQETPAP